jgi:hypothetical protein
MNDFNPFESINNLISGGIVATKRAHVTGSIYMEEAPNEVAFIESPEFLDTPKLFDAQYDVVRDFFELLCPQCNLLSNNERGYLTVHPDVPREQQVLFEYGKCPICKLEKKTIAPQLRNYHELIGIWGMRSGKSSLAGAIAGAIIHSLLCIDKLQEKLGMVKTTELFYSFLATSREQTAQTVYGIFRGMYDASPWFQRHKKMLMDLEVSDPNLRRGHLYSESGSEIEFKYRHITVQSMHSNSGTLAGRTRIGCVIDELAHFDSGESKRSATEVYRVMKNSLVTVDSLVKRKQEQGNYTFPIPRLISISSPMYSEDKIMTLEKESVRQTRVYATKKPTWEVNPTITREDLEERYISDPVGADRDFGVNPPGAENPLITDPRLVDVCIDMNKKPIIITRDKFFDLQVQDNLFNYIVLELLDVKFNNLVDYVIHCDPGKKKDSFCLAMGHKDGDVTIMDAALEARPIHKGNAAKLLPREVFFPGMTDIILELNRRLTLRAVTFDRWNSAEQIDRLRHAKILTVGKNLDRDDHVLFAESIRAQKVKLLPKEDEFLDPRITRNMPCAKAISELKSLNDNGKKVDHLPGGTNDMIQCYVGIHRLLNSPEKLFDRKDMALQNKKRAMRHISRGPTVGKVIKLKRFI